MRLLGLRSAVHITTFSESYRSQSLRSWLETVI